MPAEQAVDAATVVFSSKESAINARCWRWRARCDRDLRTEGVVVLPMHGATNIGHFLRRYGPPGLNVRVAGLCDWAEMRFFHKALESAGMGRSSTVGDLENQHFFVCDADLEDESDSGARCREGRGDPCRAGVISRRSAFFNSSPRNGKSDHARLRRFMGTRGGRKIHYAPLLVAALDLAALPRPLAGLVAAI